MTIDTTTLQRIIADLAAGRGRDRYTDDECAARDRIEADWRAWKARHPDATLISDPAELDEAVDEIFDVQIQTDDGAKADAIDRLRSIGGVPPEITRRIASDIRNGRAIEREDGNAPGLVYTPRLRAVRTWILDEWAAWRAAHPGADLAVRHDALYEIATVAADVLADGGLP